MKIVATEKAPKAYRIFNSFNKEIRVSSGKNYA